MNFNDENGGFETGNFTAWNTIGNTSIQIAEFGTIPTQGNFQALLTTGFGSVSDNDLENFLGLNSGEIDGIANENTTEGSALYKTITVEAGDILSFDFNFLTNETDFDSDPATFNDFSFVSISSNSLSQLADTSSTFFFSSTPFSEETDYSNFTFEFSEAGTYKVGIGVVDAVDTAFDSGLLIDNFKIVSADEAILGTEDGESLFGKVGNDTIYGKGGDDEIYGSEGVNTLYGGSGDDTIYGGSQADTIYGGQGNDSIFASEGDNTVFGGAGDDTVYGGSQADIIDGGTGNDTIFASEGNNTVFGGAGDDLIYGGSQADIIDGGQGNDTIFAAQGNNTVFGDGGDDTIYTGSGNDWINGGQGNDTIWLGGGQDIVVLETGEGIDTINNFQLGQTTFDVSGNPDDLLIVDGANGAEISQFGELLAVVSWNSASMLIDNIDTVFV